MRDQWKKRTQHNVAKEKRDGKKSKGIEIEGK